MKITKRFYIENKQCFTEKAWSILNQLVDNEIKYIFISDTKENLFDGIVSVEISEHLKNLICLFLLQNIRNWIFY